MLNLKLELKGLAETLSGLGALPPTMFDQFDGALRDWGEDVMTRSKSLVPFATGALRASGEVSGPELKDGNQILHLGYGDRETWYALIVHERLDVRHTTGTAKYLETPINENAHQLDDRMASALNVAIRESLK
jgi:hypothetical protein